MSTENTSLKITTPDGDSNTTNEMVVGKINNYQRTFLIVAGSLLALLVVIAAAGTRGGQHLQSSAPKIAGGTVALADYQVHSANLALTKNIFGGSAVSENDMGCFNCLQESCDGGPACDCFPRGCSCKILLDDTRCSGLSYIGCLKKACHYCNKYGECFEPSISF